MSMWRQETPSLARVQAAWVGLAKAHPGLSDAELALLVNCRAEALSNWRRGRAGRPTVELVELVEAYLKTRGGQP